MPSSQVPKLDLTKVDQRPMPRPQKKIETGPILENILGSSMVFAGMYALTTAVRRYPCRHRDALPATGVVGMFVLGMGLATGSSDKVKTVAGAVGLGLGLVMT